MKKKEVKKLSKDEAIKNISKLKKDLFNFRFQKMNSQVTNPAKIGETKKMTKSQAIKEIDKLKKDLFNFRFQKTNGQLKSPSKVREARKNIARLKTIMGNNNA